MTTSNPIQIVLKNGETDIDIIKSPVKYEILKLLRNNEMNFEEIVENMSKSKAAVSLHLKGLREEGIVKYKADPEDNRKRIFYLNSQMLGSIDTAKSKNQININEFINEDDMEFNIIMIHILKGILNEYGIEINPIFKSIGNYLGEYIFFQVYDEDIDRFLSNLSDFWQDNNLGRLSFEIKNTIRITSKNNFESMKSEKIGLPECYINVGIFEEVFSKFFKMGINVNELMCYSMGDEKCLFEIEPSCS